MAAASLPAPGTEYGPCIESCAHTDCMATRWMATSGCRICDKPIGYDQRFYQENGTGTLVHAVELEEEVTQQQKWRLKGMGYA